MVAVDMTDMTDMTTTIADITTTTIPPAAMTAVATITRAMKKNGHGASANTHGETTTKIRDQKKRSGLVASARTI
jgi:hypothetical protein